MLIVETTVDNVAQRRLSQFTRLDLSEEINAAGGWQLEVPAGTPGVEDLAPDVGGIRVVDTETRFAFTGHLTRSVETDGKTYRLSGASSTGLLANRQTLPDPDTPTPPVADVADRYGVWPVDAFNPNGGASEALAWMIDTNIGPAAHVDRAEPGMTVIEELDPAGTVPNLSIRGRFANLLELMQARATPAGFTCRIVGDGNGTLTCTVRQTRDTDVVFDGTLRNVAGRDVIRQAATANVVYVGWPSEGTDANDNPIGVGQTRKFSYSGSGAVGTAARRETFVSSTGTMNTDLADAARLDDFEDQVAAQIDAELANGAASSAIDIRLAVEGRYLPGRDFQLGDGVTLFAAGVQSTQQVTGWRLRADEGRSEWSVTAGPFVQPLARQFREIDDLNAHLQNLEAS